MSKKEQNNAEIIIYALKDKKLEEFSGLVSLRGVDVSPYFTELSSDIKSPYYSRVEDFDIYTLGKVNVENGLIDPIVMIYSPLVSFLDKERVEYQRIIQTLNFIPNGYFKMPKEMQEGVQEHIKQAVFDYVNNHADVDKLFNKFSDKEEVNN